MRGRSGFLPERSSCERRVAATEHVEEVRQVPESEARRDTQQGTGGFRVRVDPLDEEVTLLGLGVIGSSAKENEHRLPLHPEHIPHLDADLRARLTLEHGYGARFGVDDASLVDATRSWRTPMSCSSSSRSPRTSRR